MLIKLIDVRRSIQKNASKTSEPAEIVDPHFLKTWSIYLIWLFMMLKRNVDCGGRRISSSCKL